MIYSLKKYIRSINDSHYNDKLIKTLQKDHQKLFSLFIPLEEMFENEKKFKKQLEKFLKELELHLTLENSKLYTYLEKKYKYCDTSEISYIKTEIQNNASLFEKLLEYVNNKETEKAKETFEAIKNFLVKRIKFEEEFLYEAYLNTKKCSEIEEFLHNH